MPVISVDSLHDPRVAAYRDLKGSNLKRHGQWFIAEGTRVVERLLASDFETESVLLTAKREAEWAPLIRAEIPVYVLPQDAANELVGFNFHVGVVACGRRRPSPEISTLLPPDGRWSAVACPGCDNPENLGAIVRLAAGFGVQAVLLGKEGCCDPFSRRVIRVSMGTIFRQPIIECDDLPAALLALRQQTGCELIATVLDDGATPLHAASRSERIGILFGNEAQGLPPAIVERCDRRVTIPMSGGTDSLNVAVATGIVLHHYLRALPAE